MEFHIILAAAPLVSLLFSWFLIPRIQIVAFKKKLFDAPNSRTVHTGVIPRLGGVAFFPALLFAFLFTLSANTILQSPLSISIGDVSPAEWMLALCAILILYLMGLEDDLIGVCYKKKLMVQIVAALLFVMSGMWISHFYGVFGINEISSVVGIPLTIFIIVFMINAINFIDGIDGLAAGVGIIAFLYYGFVFLNAHSYLYSALAFISFGMLVPFFYYNVFGDEKKKLKIFMGDTGSLTIGMLLAIFAVKVSRIDPNGFGEIPHAIIVAFSPLFIPLLDMLKVIVYRILAGRNPFKPDKNHIHHILLELGFSHKIAMLTILLMVVFFCTLNVCLSRYWDVNIIVGLDILIWIIAHVFLRLSVKMGRKVFLHKNTKSVKLYD